MIGKVFPPYSDRKVVFFFVFNRSLEQIGKNSRKQSQQQKNDSDNHRKEWSEKCGKEQHHYGDYHTANADHSEIGHVFHNKRLAPADIHGEQPRHDQRDEDGNANAVEHGNHDFLGVGRNLDRGIIHVKVDKPRQGNVDHRHNQHDHADEEAGHMAEIEF